MNFIKLNRFFFLTVSILGPFLSNFSFATQDSLVAFERETHSATQSVDIQDEKRVSKQFSQGIVLCNLSANAHTCIRMSDFSFIENELTFKLSIDVKCNQHDSKVNINVPFIPIKGKIEIDEIFCVSTSNPDLWVSVNLRDARTVRSQTLAITQKVLEVLSNEPSQPGTGLNLNTQFANFMENFCPGVKEKFVQNYTCMALTDRKSDLASMIAEFALDIIDRQQNEQKSGEGSYSFN